MTNDQSQPMEYCGLISDENFQKTTGNDDSTLAVNNTTMGLSDMGDIQIGGTQLSSIAIPSSLESSYPRRGRQLLHQAVQNQYVSVVESLLRAGADVHAVDEYGLTPLHLAAIFGNASSVSALLAKGADVFAQEYSLSAQPIHGAAYCGSLEVANLLLARGVSVDPLTTHGWTPLIAVAANGHIQVVER